MENLVRNAEPSLGWQPRKWSHESPAECSLGVWKLGEAVSGG